MIYLKIENETAQSSALLTLLKTMPFVEITQNYVPNQTTREAMTLAEEGKVETYGSAKELLEELKR